MRKVTRDTSGQIKTIVSVESMHVLDMELARLIGFGEPFGFVKGGVSCHLKEEGFPITFCPSRNISDAMMAAAVLKLTIKMSDDHAFVSSSKADCHVDYNGHDLHHKLTAVCKGIMRVASLDLNIPLHN